MRAIFGAAGFAKETLFIFRRLNQNAKIDYFVTADDDVLVGNVLREIPVISETKFFAETKSECYEIYIAIGSPKIKEKVYERIIRWNPSVKFPALIDPSVIMDSDVGAIQIGNGSIICAGSVLTTDILIGDFSHINLNCTIGHGSKIGSFSTLSPGVHISGNVFIGESVFCGSGAVILEGLNVAHESVIGAGAVVITDTSNSGVYVGVPAKPRTNI